MLFILVVESVVTGLLVLNFTNSKVRVSFAMHSYFLNNWIHLVDYIMMTLGLVQFILNLILVNLD